MCRTPSPWLQAPHSIIVLLLPLCELALPSERQEKDEDVAFFPSACHPLQAKAMIELNWRGSERRFHSWPALGLKFGRRLLPFIKLRIMNEVKEC